MLLLRLIIHKTRTARFSIIFFLGFFISSFFSVNAQDNSPYSRYGIGDLVPPSHIISRGMGGISAGYSDVLSINLNNPAAFSSFQIVPELKSKKIRTGRAVLDLGINFESRALKETNPPKNFTANNALFSYLQIGFPIRKNWGLSFGIRPVSRISYRVIRNERLFDPITGLPIDSAATRFEGDGGVYLPSVGTGFALFRKARNNDMEDKLSLGLNLGYLFGKKDYSAKRALINDSVEYYAANYQTKTTFGDLFLSTGAQYKQTLNTAKKLSLTVGAFGNWKQNLEASQDVLRETFVFNQNIGEVRLDSVSDQRNISGILIYPSSFTIGFVLQKSPFGKNGGWLIGMDFTQQDWDDYRLYGNQDSVRNKWEVRAGGQFNPAPGRNYFSNVTYRAGFFFGPDYVQVQNKLPLFGASLGMGLPIPLSRQSPNQYSIIQLAFDYTKRGNNNNLLQENIYRISVGFSLSDYWFQKRKYD